MIYHYKLLNFFAIQSAYRIIHIRPLIEGSFVLKVVSVQKYVIYT